MAWTGRSYVTVAGVAVLGLCRTLDIPLCERAVRPMLRIGSALMGQLFFSQFASTLHLQPPRKVPVILQDYGSHRHYSSRTVRIFY